MAVNFSGGIDVTTSFVKGFSAIADVNLQRQKLNLEAAQMVQNYNLKQQEMDQKAELLEPRYNLLLSQQAHQKALTRATEAETTIKQNHATAVEDARTQFWEGLEGKKFGEPAYYEEAMKNITTSKGNVLLSPEVKDFLRGPFKEAYPRRAAEIDRTLATPISDFHLKRYRLGPHGVSAEYESNAPPRNSNEQALIKTELAAIDARLDKYGLNRSALSTSANVIKQNGMLQVRRPMKDEKTGRDIPHQWEVGGNPMPLDEYNELKARYDAATTRQASQPQYTSEEQVKADFRAGKITREQALEILRKDFLNNGTR